MLFIQLINLFVLFLRFAEIILIIVLCIYGIKALIKYLNSNNNSKEDILIKKSLGEVIKNHRIRCNMTQEFVAQHMNVSRQTISKWETGINEPSTTNLFKLAKLFNITPEELLREINI